MWLNEKFDVNTLVDIVLLHDGMKEWYPPAILQVSCEAMVKYFPFDKQNCTARFGAWTSTTRQLKVYTVSFYTYFFDQCTFDQ